MTRLFDFRALERQRNRCAASYFSSAVLPRRVEEELLERLSILTLDARSILVLGVVSPEALEQLCARFPNAQIRVIDCAADLLDALSAKTRPALASRVSFRAFAAPTLDTGADRFDLVFSNLLVPGFDDLGALFAQLHTVMRTDACLHFSCLGPDSFAELHAAWQVADPDSPWHTLVMPDMHDVGDALVHAGFREPVMDRENYTLTYSSASALLADLRDHGIGNAFAERHRGLTGRQRWSQFLEALGQHRSRDRLTLTVELVIGQAWRGDGVSQQRHPDGAVGISVDALSRRLRAPRADD